MKKPKGKIEEKKQVAVRRGFLFFALLALVIVSGLAMTQSVSAAWPPNPYAGCIGKNTGDACAGATYGQCTGVRTEYEQAHFLALERGCYAAPATCVDQGAFTSGLACVTTTGCPDKDQDSIPECKAADVNGLAPKAPTGGKYSADSYPADCDDSDPWSHSFGTRHIAKVTVDYDPIYVATVKQNQKFTPDPSKLTPLFGSMGITLNLNPVKCQPNPPRVYFNLSLTTTDSSGKEVAVPLGQKEFRLSGTSYVSGFSLTINDYDAEPFIASIAAKRPVRLKFEAETHLNHTDTSKYHPLPMTNCAQVYGGGKIKVVYMRGKSATLSVGNISTLANSSIESFLTIPPFKQSTSSFSHYLDIAIYDDDQFSTFNLGGGPLINGYLPQDAGSCGRDKQVRLGYHVLATSRTYEGWAPPGTRTIFLGKAVRARAKDNLGNLVLHEFTHSFARLSDEYIYLNRQIPIIFTLLGLAKRNCTTDPDSDYSYEGKLYGSKDYIGCSFNLSPSGKALYRPSFNSIMNDGISFNIPSCGWIKKAINGGLAKSYFPECAAMPGIIPVGQ